MARTSTPKQICRAARTSALVGHTIGHLRDLCDSFRMKADAQGYVIGPGGGRSKKSEVAAAIRRVGLTDLRLKPRRPKRR